MILGQKLAELLIVYPILGVCWLVGWLRSKLFKPLTAGQSRFGAWIETKPLECFYSAAPNGAAFLCGALVILARRVGHLC